MNLLVIFLGIFIILLFIGTPIFLSLLSSSLVYCFLRGGIDTMMVMQKMFNSLDNFILLAIPMFMLAGILMNTGGVTDRIFYFCKSLVGHLPGGLAFVNVLASFIFSGMSGSALADVGGLGQIEMKAMEDEGYDDIITLGVTAASSTMGPIVPPSIPMVLYGSAASVSVGALFAAGFIPGLIIAMVLCIIIAIVAKRKGFPIHERASLKEIFRRYKSGFWALLMPIVIMSGIWCGYFTPTEAACVSIVYVLIIQIFVYKGLKFKQIPGAISEMVVGIVPALAIVSSVALFGWVLQFEHLGTIILKGILSISENRNVVLLLINIILLMMGCFLDSTAVILMFIPMFLPLVKIVGINEIHLGVIVVLNLMIGLMTPPVGQSLYMMASVTGKSFGHVVKNTWSWLIPLFISLIIITYSPNLVLWFPRLLGLIS